MLNERVENVLSYMDISTSEKLYSWMSRTNLYDLPILLVGSDLSEHGMITLKWWLHELLGSNSSDVSVLVSPQWLHKHYDYVCEELELFYSMQEHSLNFLISGSRMPVKHEHIKQYQKDYFNFYHAQRVAHRWYHDHTVYHVDVISWRNMITELQNEGFKHSIYVGVDGNVGWVDDFTKERVNVMNLTELDGISALMNLFSI